MNDKHNLDHHHDGSDGHAAVPESAQFIEESTLIPPSSSYGLDGESVQVINESSAETAPDGTETVNNTTVKTTTKTGSSTSKNPAIIGAGVLGLALIGAFGLIDVFGFKMLNNQQDAQPQQVQVVVQPATQPAPVPSVAKIEPVAPVAQVVAVTPVAQVTPVAPALMVPPVAPVVQVVAVAPVVKAPVALVPLQVATPAATPVANADAVRALSDQVNTVNGRTSVNRTDIVDLQDRVAKLEAGKAGSGGTAVGSGKSTVSKPVTGAQRAAAEQRRVNAAAARGRSAEERAEFQRHETMITKNAGFYHVHALKDNLVWLSTKDDQVMTFSVGDQVPGVGTLTRVNEKGRNVIAGGRAIR